MNNTFLAIDPGSHALGYALFIEGFPESFGVYRSKYPDIWSRIDDILGQFAPRLLVAGDVAIEDPHGFKGQNTRALMLMLGSIKGMYRQAAWWPYHQSTVKRATVPRGMPLTKASAHSGLIGLIEQEGWINVEHARHLEEDALDALCVGVAHLNAVREASHAGE